MWIYFSVDTRSEGTLTILQSDWFLALSDFAISDRGHDNTFIAREIVKLISFRG